MTREDALEMNAAAAALFNARVQNITDSAALVDAAYANLLGLEGEFSNAAARKAYWVDKLQSGELTSDAFAGEFLYLAENVPGPLTDEEFGYNQVAVPIVADNSRSFIASLSAEGREIAELTQEELMEVISSILAAVAQAHAGGAVEDDTANDDTASGNTGITLPSYNTPSPERVSLDELDSTDQEYALFDAGTGSFLFEDDASLQSNTLIENFGEDDSLLFVGVEASDVRIHVSGDNAVIQFDDGENQLSQVELVGVNGFFTNVNEFNQAIAGDGIQFA